MVNINYLRNHPVAEVIILMPAKQSRAWVFTLNNYTEEEYESIRGVLSSDEVEYGVVGRERGESGTPHLQGFVMFMRKKALGGCKRELGSDRIHVEISRGTPTQASEYCKKDGDYVEFGEIERVRTQGSRTDLARVQDLLRAGTPLSEVADQEFRTFIRYHRGIALYASLRITRRSWRTQVVWFHGPTGTGKSRRAYTESMALCNGSVAYIADPSLKWLDPYSGEKGVVLDDFDGTAPISMLLRLFDRYPLRVPIKGGFVEFSARIVWITSNFTPEHLYGGSPQYDALRRRLDEVELIE